MLNRPPNGSDPGWGYPHRPASPGFAATQGRSPGWDRPDSTLPPTFLRRVLREDGGIAAPTLYVGARGKGRDDGGTRPRQALAVGRPTRAEPTLSEQLLGDLGLHAVAAALREARLASSHADPLLRQAQLAQLNVNVPLLLLAGYDLLRRAETENIDTLLMCSRDCNLWIALLRWLTPRTSTRPVIRYFAASRVLFLSESPAYDGYFRQARGHRNFIVDVAGTGRSAAHFIGRIGAQASTRLYTAVHGRSETTDFVSKMTVSRHDVAVDSLCQRPFETRFPLECLNVSLEGRAHRAAFADDAIAIEHEPNEYGPAARAVITAMRASFLHALDCISHIDGPALPRHIDAAPLRAASILLLGQLESLGAPLRPIRSDTLSQEAHVGAAAKLQRHLPKPRMG